MVKRKLVLGFLCFCYLIFISSCWDSRDIEDLTIAIAAGYDTAKQSGSHYDDKENKVAVTGVFPLFEEEVVSSATVATNEAKTIAATRVKRAYKTPRKLLLGMLQAAVYGDELARKGLYGSIEILLRDPQVKHDVLMALAYDRAEDVFKTKINNYSNVGNYVFDLLKNSRTNAFIPTVTIHAFAMGALSDCKNPVLPIIKPGINSIEIVGLGIFRGDRLIARASTDEARIISFLRGEEMEGYLPFAIEKEGKIFNEGSVYVKNSRKVEVYRKGNIYNFNITVKLKGDVVEQSSQRPLSEKGEELKEIEKSVAKDIKMQCESMITKIKTEYKVDCIDISRFAMAKWRKELKKIINDEDFIRQANINVDVDVVISRKGEMQ